jgi:hypothetical protein
MSIWSRLARAGFEIIESDGRHLDMVTVDAGAVAQLIDARLPQAELRNAAYFCKCRHEGHLPHCHQRNARLL